MTSKLTPTILFLAILSMPCLAEETIIFDGNKEIRLKDNFNVSKCNNLGLAECPNCIDTPNYYFSLETKQLISSCAGACWHPRDKQRQICKTLCPPPEWTCK